MTAPVIRVSVSARVPGFPWPAPDAEPRYRLVLPYAAPTANELRKLHFAAKNKWKAKAAWELRAALAAQLRPVPRTPLARAAVRFERASRGVPDADNLVGGLKLLLDVLLPMGEPYRQKRGAGFVFAVPHPHGLGFVADDAPTALAAEYLALALPPRADPSTTITIWEV